MRGKLYPALFVLALAVGLRPSPAEAASVKSLQTALVNPVAATPGTTVTLGTAVATDKSIVICTAGMTGGDSNDRVTCELTGTTTLEIKNDSTGSNNIVRYYVIEFEGGVSVQRNTQAFASTDLNKTVTLGTAVDCTKSFVVLAGEARNAAAGSASNDEVFTIRAILGGATPCTSGTTSTLYLVREDSGTAATVAWQVVTMDHPSVSVQRGTVTMAQTDATATATLTTGVDTNYSFIVMSRSGGSAISGYEARYQTRGKFTTTGTSVTGLTFTRAATGGASNRQVEISYQVVSLGTASSNEGSTVVRGATSGSGTHTQMSSTGLTLDTTRAVPFFTASGGDTSFNTYLDETSWTAALTATSIVFDRGPSASLVSTADWFVAQFYKCGAVSDLSYVSAKTSSSTAVTLYFPSSPVIVLRKTAAQGAFTAADFPVKGVTYATGSTSGPNGIAVLYNSTSAVSSYTDNSPSAGEKNYYKVLARSSTNNGPCYATGAAAQTEVDITPGQTNIAWTYMQTGGSQLKPGIAGTGVVYPSNNAGRIVSIDTATGAESSGWTAGPVATSGAIQGWLTWVPLNLPAAIAVDAVSSGTAGVGSSSITVSHTTGSGANRLMLVGITITNDNAPIGGPRRAINSLTYGGTPLTEVATVYIDDDARVSIYRLIAPASGTANVVATLDGAVSATDGGIMMGVMTFTGVHQTTPLGTPTTESEGDGSIAVTSAAGELVFDTISLEDGSLTVNASQTQRWNLATGIGVGGASTEPGAASVTMSWNTGLSTHRAHAGVSIKRAAVSTNAVIAGDQGGKVYAVNAATGAKAWTEYSTGATAIQAGVAVQLYDYSNGPGAGTFKGTYTSDIIFAASMNGATTNKLYAIKAFDGTLAWSFNGTVESGTSVSDISGMPYVDYARNRIYVASKAASGRSLWVINSLTGASIACNSTDCTMGSLDSSPTLSYDGASLYVGDTAGNLYALNTNTLARKWTFALGGGNGSLEGFVWEDSSTAGRLYFTTTTGKVMCVQDNGASAAACGGWTVPTVAAASTPLLLNKLFLGSSDGKVHQINLTNGTDERQVTIDLTKTVGDVSTETGNEIFVGTTDGKLYKITLVSGALP